MSWIPLPAPVWGTMTRVRPIIVTSCASGSVVKLATPGLAGVSGFSTMHFSPPAEPWANVATGSECSPCASTASHAVT